MPQKLKQEIWDELLPVLETYLGTAHLKLRKNDLEKSLALAAERLNLTSLRLANEIIQHKTTDKLDLMAEYITVGETYFFRHKHCFELINYEILPALLAQAQTDKRREINFWCAGCASGEEPYSLAIVVDNFALPVNFKVNIYASDINQNYLERAKAGLYTEWSFRELPDVYKRKYFNKVNTHNYQLDEKVRQKVKFFKYNLLANHLPELEPGRIDMVFCRNVLIYFNNEQISSVFRKFNLLLNAKGFLLTSPAEVTAAPGEHFKPVNYSGTYFFRKNSEVPAEKISAFDECGQQVAEPVIKRAKNVTSKKPVAPPKPKKRLSQLKPALKVVPKPEPAVKSKTPVPEIPIDELLQMARDLNRITAPEEADRMARACANAGMLEEALHWSRQVLNFDNLNAERHYFHAQILKETGNINEAQQELKRVLFLNPDFISGYIALGMLQLKSGNSKEAQRNLRNAGKMLSSMPDDQEVPGSDGVTARNMRETLERLMG